MGWNFRFVSHGLDCFSEEDVRDKGKLYKPSSRLEAEHEKANDYVKMVANESKKELLANNKKKAQEKKKSNLELFKEELRQIQEEREERHKYKHMAKSMVPASSTSLEQETYKEEKETGSFDNGDPNTTNLYLGNLNPKVGWVGERRLGMSFVRFYRSRNKR